MGVSRDFPIFGVPPIISGARKVMKFKFGTCIQSVHANKSSLIIWEKREHGRIEGLPKFFEYTLLPQECESYELQIWQVYSQGPSEQNALKNLGEKGAWTYPGTAQIS